MDTTTTPAGMQMRFRYTGGWAQKLCLTADWHFDSVYCDRKKLKEDLDEAARIGAPIFCFGDVTDEMQGKGDRRAEIRHIRPEYIVKGECYRAGIAEDVADFVAPYIDLLTVSLGNHDTGPRRHTDSSAVEMLRIILRERHGFDRMLGYRGHIQYRFEHKAGGGRTSRTGFFHHGYGGGGPVTKGVIQTNRRATYLPTADYIYTGHIHEGWIVPLKQHVVSQSGNDVARMQWHVQIPTYKEEYFVDSHDGFHIETGRPPKPIGCVWQEWRHSDSRGMRTHWDLDIV